MIDSELMKYAVRSEGMIYDGSFKYLGDSLDIHNIVNAIKTGAVLVDIYEVRKEFKQLESFIKKWKKTSTSDEVLLLVESLEQTLYDYIGIPPRELEGIGGDYDG